MLKKRYSADKRTCNVTFVMDGGLPKSARAASLVGEFNAWDPQADPMKRRKDGTFAVSKVLPCGRAYAFRYLIEGGIWRSDDAADGCAPTPFADAENSIVSV